MKKIMIAALSILIGACGYTIVDKELTKRVDDLERSVSSLQEIVDNSVATTNADSIVYKAGDSVPIAKNQPSNYKLWYVHYTDLEHSSDVYSYIDVDYDPSRTEIYGKIFDEAYFNVSLTDLKATIRSVSSKTNFSKYQYTTQAFLNNDYTVQISAKGNTSKELAGMKIRFVVNYSDARNISENYTEITADIDSNGNFVIDECVKYAEVNGKDRYRNNLKSISLVNVTIIEK